MITDLASQLAATDIDGKDGGLDMSDYKAVLEAYALREGTGETAVVVPVSLRFDEKPTHNATWWYAEASAVKSAVSLIGVTTDLVVNAVHADTAIAKIHRSPTFRFDLMDARPVLSEFIIQCVEIWEATDWSEPANRQIKPGQRQLSPSTEKS